MPDQPDGVRRAPGADREAPPGMPRWVKICLTVVGVLIALFLVAQLTGLGGQHGPGRHMSGQGAIVITDLEGQSFTGGSPA